MSYPPEVMAAYISQLNPMEQKVLNIAASHLETSFSLVKSIGFQEWLHAAAPLPVQPPPLPKQVPNQVPKQVPKQVRKKIRI
jgi:hypothetical protein